MPPASRRQANVAIGLLLVLLALELVAYVDSPSLAVAALLVLVAVATGVASLVSGRST